MKQYFCSIGIWILVNLFTFRRTSSNLELVIDNDLCASLTKETLPRTLVECGSGSANSDVSTSFLEESTSFFLGTYGINTVAQPAWNFGGGEMFNFRQITLFCMGYHLSRYKMTIYAKILGGMAPRTDFLSKSNFGFRFFHPNPTTPVLHRTPKLGILVEMV